MPNPLTVSDAANIIKEVYLPDIQEGLNSGTILLDHTMKNKSPKFVGDEMHFPLHSARNTGIGARAESGTLPTAGSQTYLRAKYKRSFQYGVISLTGPVMAGTEGDRAAFIPALEAEMKGVMTDLRVLVNKQLFGNGTGLITRCEAGAANTTVLCAHTHQLRVGDLVDVRTRSTGADVTSGVSVDAISADVDFTASASVTEAATDGVYRVDTHDTTNAIEMFGLAAYTDTADIVGLAAAQQPGQISKTSNAVWQGNIIDVAGALAFSDMHRMWNLISIQSGEQPDIVITSHQGQEAYGALFDNNRRWNNTMRLRGGYTGLEFNGIGVFADKDCHDPENADPEQDEMYFINSKTFFHAIQKDWDWMSGENGILSKKRASSGAFSDEWEGALHSYRQWVCLNCNRNGKLHSFTVTDLDVN